MKQKWGLLAIILPQPPSLPLPPVIPEKGDIVKQDLWKSLMLIGYPTFPGSLIQGRRLVISATFPSTGNQIAILPPLLDRLPHRLHLLVLTPKPPHSLHTYISNEDQPQPIKVPTALLEPPYHTLSRPTPEPYHVLIDPAGRISAIYDGLYLNKKNMSTLKKVPEW